MHRLRSKSLKLHYGRFRLDISKDFFLSLAQAAQEGGGVTVPGGVPEPCGCGTENTVSVGGMVGMGWQLDQVILVIFPTLTIL